MKITREEASARARDWCGIVDWGEKLDPLDDFAQTGRISSEDHRKRCLALMEALGFFARNGGCDALRDYIKAAPAEPDPCELAARARGWTRSGGLIFSTYEFKTAQDARNNSKAVTYDTWQHCCEAEDIPVTAEA